MAKSRSTSKKRKATAAAPSAGEDPRAFIEKVREEKAADLEKKPGGRRRTVPGDDLDVDHLTRLISALISTNEEIWQRCKGSRMKADEPNCYKRVIYRYIQVPGTIQFSTSPSFEVSSNFTIPTISDLPNELTSMIVVSPREDESKLPDYEKLFKSALLFQDDVLLPLLKVFKEHLEEVQVHLGMIEDWLTQPKSCESFLKETFGSPEDPTDLPDPKINGCPSGCRTCHSPSDVCMNCGRTYSTHATTSPYQNSRYTGNRYDQHVCPGKALLAGATASFFKPETVLLKTIHDSKCSHEEEFDLTDDEARDRLKKFLDYVS